MVAVARRNEPIFDDWDEIVAGLESLRPARGSIHRLFVGYEFHSWVQRTAESLTNAVAHLTRSNGAARRHAESVDQADRVGLGDRNGGRLGVPRHPARLRVRRRRDARRRAARCDSNRAGDDRRAVRVDSRPPLSGGPRPHCDQRRALRRGVARCDRHRRRAVDRSRLRACGSRCGCGLARQADPERASSRVCTNPERARRGQRRVEHR